MLLLIFYFIIHPVKCLIIFSCITNLIFVFNFIFLKLQLCIFVLKCIRKSFNCAKQDPFSNTRFFLFSDSCGSYIEAPLYLLYYIKKLSMSKMFSSFYILFKSSVYAWCLQCAKIYKNIILLRNKKKTDSERTY